MRKFKLFLAAISLTLVLSVSAAADIMPTGGFVCPPGQTCTSPNNDTSSTDATAPDSTQSTQTVTSVDPVTELLLSLLSSSVGTF